MLRAALFTLLLLASCAAGAAERILSYHSDIQINADGSMVVTETIQVAAEGDRIKRGIYRDFPTTYKDNYGNTYKVDFDVFEILRDGQKEKWHTERKSNGVRIYLGDADVYLDRGTYTYTIRYHTDWQLGFFQEKDELYWNVTGNGWVFPIERASARVVLPRSVPVEQLHMGGYTGPQGSTAKNYASSVTVGAGSISTTLALGQWEGLTLVFDWPKGIVNEPSDWRRFLHLMENNLGLLLALLALSGSSGYLFSMWHRHGRDPEEGVIFPHYEPPEDHSPASLRYVQRMGYDNKTFTAAIINLAVKGHIMIDCEKRMFGLKEDYLLKRQPSDQPLSPGEQEVLNKLFIRGTVLELKNKNHSIVSGARSAHKKALSKGYHNRYFRNNLVLMIPAALGSLLIVALIGFSGLFVPWLIIVYVLIALVLILFLWLLKAPSYQGRKLMDKSKGFQMYLEVAEKDELNMRNPPELTPRLFEAYLPFAIALGVEQKWAEQFADVFAKLAASGKAGSNYHPAWYRGDFDHNNINKFSSAVGSGLNSAISSAAQAPGSSSGGGGGSSGGGGGGGGGGGW